MSKALLRSGFIVSAMTLISRVLGLVRDVVIANLMGAGAAADVFFFANKIPNFLRRLFAEGAFAQAFVPVLTEYKQGKELPDQQLLIARVSGTLGTIVTVVTIFGVVASPVVAALFGMGWFLDWWNDGPQGQKFVLASDLLRITFPYLWFISFAAMAGAILNTLGKFAVAAFTPVFLNVAIIAAAIWLAPQMEQPEYALAWGVFFGGFIQLLFQLPFLKKAGLLVKPKWGWKDPGVTKIRKLMLPAIFGVSVSQINLLLDTLIASFLMTGSISWLYYSDRLLEFPLGLFGIAIATVILPALSSRHVDKSTENFSATLDWGIRMVLLLGVPAMAGLFVLAEPMLMVLFMHGAFSPDDARMASYSLMAYSTGLLSFMMVKVLATGFYSRQDTKRPVKYGIIAMVANMVFNIALAIPFSYVGLALATAASAAINAGLLGVTLWREGVLKKQPGTGRFILQVLFATAAMIAGVLWLSPDIEAWRTSSLVERPWLLAQVIGFGAAIYIGALGLTGMRPGHFRAREY
ncbi:putative peptidoglycan lipid II flippase [Idiomarina loihiensis]|uniref:murein biosynthesis integral membrane protein MurJ n=1 Tax=Idiomarina TaxID=135575 RepID=UPI000D714D74|nr:MULTISPECIES: murein biosynthesis integral membrane protein MurJ [Idiomarina]PWW41701.1 putative peptidoglycan lipid II flippase [Idiomarina loihiensis]TDP50759.1 putative peptidoglycan lipid II flippase [Idiomarina loihiensis]TDS24963.1 putative peptidoglycan lipid II flippase [Idiomarina sp. H2]